MCTAVWILIGGTIGAIVGTVVASLATVVLSIGPVANTIIILGFIILGCWRGYQRANPSSTY